MLDLKKSNSLDFNTFAKNLMIMYTNDISMKLKFIFNLYDFENKG